MRSHSAAVRPAVATDTAGLADVLARAFQADPVNRWILPDDDRRRRTLPAVYALLLRTWFITRAVTEVAVRDGRIAACALWNPPDRPQPPPSVLLRQLPTTLRLAGRGFPRLIRATGAIAAARPAEPHWHLAELAADPDVQRTGLGTRLLRHGLTRCDADGVPAYLEAPEDNVAYYRRFGFTVTDTITIPSGPTVHGMRRTPIVTR